MHRARRLVVSFMLLVSIVSGVLPAEAYTLRYDTGTSFLYQRELIWKKHPQGGSVKIGPGEAKEWKGSPLVGLAYNPSIPPVPHIRVKAPHLVSFSVFASYVSTRGHLYQATFWCVAGTQTSAAVCKLETFLSDQNPFWVESGDYIYISISNNGVPPDKDWQLEVQQGGNSNISWPLYRG